MARVSTIVTNFRAGELSPRLEGRIDLDKYNEAEQFFAYMPTLVHTVQYDCKECNTHNRIAINGYEHFFA